MSDLSIKRVADFVRCPQEHPLTRGEQMELAQFFLEIQEQIATFKALPDIPITDGHIQQVINSHEKGWAMIVPTIWLRKFRRTEQVVRESNHEVWKRHFTVLYRTV